MDTLEYSSDYPLIYEYEPEVHTLNPFVAFMHLVFFAAFMLCLVVIEVFPKTATTLLIRQLGYAFYIIVILLLKGGKLRETGRREFIYILCALVVAITILLTTVTLGTIRFKDIFGPASFLLGVYVFAIVLPRSWGAHAEKIIMSGLLLQVTTVVIAIYVLGIRDTGIGSTDALGNALPAYCGLGALLLAGVGSRKGMTMMMRVFCWTSALAFGFVMATALGRTSIIACLGTYMIVIWTGSTFNRKLLMMSLQIVVLVALAALGYTDIITEKFIHKGGQDIESMSTLTGRTDIWMAGFREGGLLWLGKGQIWIHMVSGQAAHSSYFGIYFNYGIFAAVFWLIMCIMGVWASIKMLLLYKRSGQYPLAPFCVFYYLILGLAETYFDVIISGFGALFYISCGLCMLELRRHKNEAIYGYLTEMDYIYDSDFAAQD